jgi:hypothetical protein
MATTTKQQQTKPLADPVSDAEKVIAKLQVQREKLMRRQAEHEAERSRLAYAARAQGDAEASKRLSEMADEAVHSEHEASDIGAALATARSFLKDAQAAEARAEDQARAAEARQLVKELAEVFPFVDKHLALAARGLLAIYDGVAKLHAAGFTFPSNDQVRINLAEVIETWAHSLPRSLHNQLRDGVRFLPPGTRKSASQFWAAIEATLNNSITGAVDAPVSKAPAMQRPNARDRQEAAAATREFLGAGGV